MALIDYFHDLSLVRDGDSINFQKASCTLEGCVKVYSSRVESVSTETAKLLSGLANAILDSGAAPSTRFDQLVPALPDVGTSVARVTATASSAGTVHRIGWQGWRQRWR